jgi:hypothetical protein
VIRIRITIRIKCIRITCTRITITASDCDGGVDCAVILLVIVLAGVGVYAWWICGDCACGRGVYAFGGFLVWSIRLR